MTSNAVPTFGFHCSFFHLRPCIRQAYQPHELESASCKAEETTDDSRWDCWVLPAGKSVYRTHCPAVPKGARPFALDLWINPIVCGVTKESTLPNTTGVNEMLVSVQTRE